MEGGEPYDGRLSRTVRRAAGGEVPSADSTSDLRIKPKVSRTYLGKFGEMDKERTWIRSQLGEKRYRTKRRKQSSWVSNLRGWSYRDSTQSDYQTQRESEGDMERATKQNQRRAARRMAKLHPRMVELFSTSRLA